MKLLITVSLLLGLSSFATAQVPTTYISTTFNSEAAAGATLAGTSPATDIPSSQWSFPTTGSSWAYQTGGGVTSTTGMNEIAVINGGVADATVTYTIASAVPNAGEQLVLRWTDVNNFLAVNIRGTGLAAFDIVNGQTTQIGLPATISSGVGTFTVLLNGSTFTVTGNGGTLTGTTRNVLATVYGFNHFSNDSLTVGAFSVVSGTSSILRAVSTSDTSFNVGDLLVADASGNAHDSGVTLSSLQSSGAPLSGAAFTGPVSGPSFTAPLFISGNTTNNGSLTLPFNGTAATAPGPNAFQISPAIPITTPWSLSPAPQPGTGYMFGTAAGGVVQQSFRTVSGLLTTLTAASGNLTVTGNAASQVLSTFTVPANTIPALGCLKVEFDAFLSTGTAVGKTFSLSFGSASLSWTADTAGTSGQTYNGSARICNNGSTGSQVIIARPMSRGAGLISGNAAFAAAVDTTAAQTLAISWTAPATEIVQVRLMTVELTR